MEDVNIKGTLKTPEIRCTAASGLLEIRGRSIPGNAVEFYEPVVKWIEDYSEKALKNTKAIIELEYFNTSSSKMLLDILKQLEKLQLSGKSDVLLEWVYEQGDEDLKQAALEYNEFLHIQIDLVETDPD